MFIWKSCVLAGHRVFPRFSGTRCHSLPAASQGRRPHTCGQRSREGCADPCPRSPGPLHSAPCIQCPPWASSSAANPRFVTPEWPPFKTHTVTKSPGPGSPSWPSWSRKLSLLGAPAACCSRYWTGANSNNAQWGNFGVHLEDTGCVRLPATTERLFRSTDAPDNRPDNQTAQSWRRGSFPQESESNQNADIQFLCPYVHIYSFIQWSIL